MSEDRSPEDRPVEDPGANTEMWQAFAKDDPQPAKPKAVGAPFRILTLLGGLAVFAVLVWLLLFL
jgi:hypothetical protein